MILIAPDSSSQSVVKCQAGGEGGGTEGGRKGGRE